LPKLLAYIPALSSSSSRSTLIANVL